MTKSTAPLWRRQVVAFVRRGKSQRQAGRRFGVSLCTVRRWVGRAGGERLDRVEFAGKPPGCGRAANRTRKSLEDRVLSVRKRLKGQSDLGEYGAAAIRREMVRLKLKRVPSVPTIGRILRRRGALVQAQGTFCASGSSRSQV